MKLNLFYLFLTTFLLANTNGLNVSRASYRAVATENESLDLQCSSHEHEVKSCAWESPQGELFVVWSGAR